MFTSWLIKFSRRIHGKIYQHQSISRYSVRENEEEPEIPRNELERVISAHQQSEMGQVYDKKPFKLRFVAGKTYFWCSCGQSKSQPICDGTHSNIFLKIKMKPVPFQVKKTKEYWLCNCKQTSNRPFCDGTHMRADIQEKKF